MVRVIVLGCGLIGSSIVEDLARDSRLRVTAVDNREDNLSRLPEAANITRQVADLRTPEAVRSLAAEADLVVGAVPGFKGDAAILHTYELYDEFDRTAGRTSMARTTAFPCALVARLVLDGAIGAKGIVPPESIGADSRLMQRVLDGLAERGVHLRHETRDAEPWS